MHRGPDLPSGASMSLLPSQISNDVLMERVEFSDATLRLCSESIFKSPWGSWTQALRRSQIIFTQSNICEREREKLVGIVVKLLFFFFV